MSITRIKSLDTQNDLMLQVSFCARMMTTASPYPLILRVAEASCWTSLLPHLLSCIPRHLSRLWCKYLPPQNFQSASCIRFAGYPTMFIDVFLRCFNACFAPSPEGLLFEFFFVLQASGACHKHGLLPRTRLNIPSKSSFVDFSDGFQQCLGYCCCVKSRVLKSVRRL